VPAVNPLDGSEHFPARARPRIGGGSPFQRGQPISRAMQPQTKPHLEPTPRPRPQLATCTARNAAHQRHPTKRNRTERNPNPTRRKHGNSPIKFPPFVRELRGKGLVSIIARP
jgi:hypothetical protein